VGARPAPTCRSPGPFVPHPVDFTSAIESAQQNSGSQSEVCPAPTGHSTGSGDHLRPEARDATSASVAIQGGFSRRKYLLRSPRSFRSRKRFTWCLNKAAGRMSVDMAQRVTRPDRSGSTDGPSLAAHRRLADRGRRRVQRRSRKDQEGVPRLGKRAMAAVDACQEDTKRQRLMAVANSFDGPLRILITPHAPRLLPHPPARRV
jgi:hypothetical protein